VTKYTNVRIIAATNQRLKELVEQNRFRCDLYFRLRGFELNLSPLRDRVEDIPILAEHAAAKYAKSIHRKIAGISAEVLQVSAETGDGMESWYDWLRHERAHHPALAIA